VVPLSLAFVIAVLFMMAVMALAWRYEQRWQNAGIVDVAFTFGVGLLAVAGLVFVCDGLPTRRWLVGALVSAWSLRLGGHLVRRLAAPEDERYRRLRAQYGDHARLRMLLFFQSQALACPLFALPMLLAGESAAPLGIADLLGVILGCLALWGEWSADRQLATFRRNPENRGRVCDAGWWRYSRHPNYFFEWLYWWSYPPLALHAPLGGLAILAPLAMGYFLCFVTGVPPAEAHLLSSRGDAYRDYQRRTSVFIPWFRRPN
jgi:steroid 5-alpha reductase family enzyme